MADLATFRDSDDQEPAGSPEFDPTTLAREPHEAPSFDEPPRAQPDTEAMERLLAGLNEAQGLAVRATDGPVMIVAGPGSGKTRTLTHRIAYLLAAKKAWPSQVLALTFTNKAAREMRERVGKLVGADAGKGLWMGTFHAIFARLLRREAGHLGFTSDFSIYDSDDTERLLKELMPRFQVDPKLYSPRAMRGRISGAKNGLVTPTEYLRLAADPAEQAAAKLFGPYVEALRRANAMDFDDLLLHPIRLFEAHPEVLESYQRRWRYLLIDEYQDTNRAQYVLAKMLAAKHRNLCVVGDDAQSIYAFRGADIQNILSFQRDYPEAVTVRLEQNYRSTGRILKLAASIIKQNKDQLDKALFTDNREGEHVRVFEALSERDEAQKIERNIRDLSIRAGLSWKDYAVLYRTNAQSRSIEEALRRGGIPYRLVGGVSFYQRKEIKDALAYLRLAVNPDDQASLQRVINTPVRGIGDKSVDALRNLAAQENLSLWQAAQRPKDAGLTGKTASAVEGFAFLLGRYASKVASTPADELARGMIQESGLLQSYRDENTPESLARIENVHELMNAIAEFTDQGDGQSRTLSEFLQEVSLVADVDGLRDDEQRVTLMTLHASKGLEFKVVFVTGLEEGLFPLAMAAQDPKELEEERRLFYVGVTRAEELLFLTYARSRYRYGDQQPSVRSRFLDEVDAEDTVRTESGLAFEGQKGRFSLGSGSTSGYDSVDPYYWRQSLRPETPKPAAKPRGGGTRPGGYRPAGGTPAFTPPAPRERVLGDGRRIVYDEAPASLDAGADTPDTLGIVPGIRVRHATFGPGKVLDVEGTGERAAATVFFQSVGQKKLKLKFARLDVLG